MCGRELPAAAATAEVSVSVPGEYLCAEESQRGRDHHLHGRCCVQRHCDFEVHVEGHSIECSHNQRRWAHRRSTVDSTGLGGQRITATLTADDGSSDPACAQSAQAVSVVAPLQKKMIVAQEFDECNNCTFDDQKARLDNLAVELQNDPSTRAYIIAYGGRMSPLGQVEMLMSRARDYLVTQRGIDASRFVVVNGGFREEDSVELWMVPSGAAAPQATPTVQAGEVKPAPARRKRD